MNQLSLSLPDRVHIEPRYPQSSQRQLWDLLEALRRGERLTVLSAIEEYGCYALSQRCGELRKPGWPVQSRVIETPTRKHVKAYWL